MTGYRVFSSFSPNSSPSLRVVGAKPFAAANCSSGAVLIGTQYLQLFNCRVDSWNVCELPQASQATLDCPMLSFSGAVPTDRGASPAKPIGFRGLPQSSFANRRPIWSVVQIK